MDQFISLKQKQKKCKNAFKCLNGMSKNTIAIYVRVTGNNKNKIQVK